MTLLLLFAINAMVLPQSQLTQQHQSLHVLPLPQQQLQAKSQDAHYTVSLLQVPPQFVLLVQLVGFQVPLVHNVTHAPLLMQAAQLSQHQLVMHGQPQHLLGLHAPLSHQMLNHAGSPQLVQVSSLHAAQDITYPLQEHVLLVLPLPQTALLVRPQDVSSAYLDISYLVPQTAQTAQETVQVAEMPQPALLV